MPTFFARSTSIQLCAASIEATTTRNPVLHQHPDVYKTISGINETFDQASWHGGLTEEPLCDEDTKSHMRFLGPRENMPFFLVHAGKDFFMEKNELHSSNICEPSEYQSLAEKILLARLSTENISGAIEGDVVRAEDRNAQAQHKKKLHAKHSYQPPLVPHALCLNVYLSKSSFLPCLERERETPPYNDVKIDVYFNGELCGSTYVPVRYRSDSYYATEQIIRFTGRRIGRVVEKPWIIVPPVQGVSKSRQGHERSRHPHITTEERWNQVSNALLMETKRLERENGESSVLGDYLSSLATMEMPFQIEKIQKSAGLNIGVVDVVVLSGRGRRDDTTKPFILEPTPTRVKRRNQPADDDFNRNLKDMLSQSSQIKSPKEMLSEEPNEEHGIKSGLDVDCLSLPSPSRNLKSRGQNKAKNPDTSLSNNVQSTIANLESSPQDLDVSFIDSLFADTTGVKESQSANYHRSDLAADPSLALHRTQNHPQTPAKKSSSPSKRRKVAFSPITSDQVQVDKEETSARESSHASGSAPASQQLRKVASPIRNPSKSRRYPRFSYEIVLDNTMTAAEEIEMIAAEAAKPENLTDNKYSGSRRTRSSLSSNETSTPESTVPKPTNEEEMVVKLRIRALKPPFEPKAALSSTSSPLTSPPMTPSAFSLPSTPPTARSIPDAATDAASAITQQPQLPHRPSRPRPLNHKQTLGSWQIPPLSRDCTLTYASEGVYRQVKGERGGWFEETEVVMGSRFLVACDD